MKLLIAGGSGFIGQALSRHLNLAGYDLTLLSRNKQHHLGSYHNILSWDELPYVDISDFDAVINLCGLNIADRRWSEEVKTQLVDSRVNSTKRLIDCIDNSEVRLLNASALSFYPFSEKLQSESNSLEFEGDYPFSKEIVEEWEKCLEDKRLTNPTALRFGVIIGVDGGILHKMLMPSKLCINPVLGDGSQIVSWMAIDDVCRAIQLILEKPIIAPAINFTTENPVSNKALTKAISQQIKRPQFLRMPASAVKFLFGQMGEELMLASHNVKPEVLLEAGFEFKYPTIEKALEQELQ